jgi:hypothetical protein
MVPLNQEVRTIGTWDNMDDSTLVVKTILNQRLPVMDKKSVWSVKPTLPTYKSNNTTSFEPLTLTVSCTSLEMYTKI